MDASFETETVNESLKSCLKPDDSEKKFLHIHFYDAVKCRVYECDEEERIIKSRRRIHQPSKFIGRPDYVPPEVPKTLKINYANFAPPGTDLRKYMPNKEHPAMTNLNYIAEYIIPLTSSNNNFGTKTTTTNQWNHQQRCSNFSSSNPTSQTQRRQSFGSSYNNPQTSTNYNSNVQNGNTRRSSFSSSASGSYYFQPPTCKSSCSSQSQIYLTSGSYAVITTPKSSRSYKFQPPTNFNSSFSKSFCA